MEVIYQHDSENGHLTICKTMFSGNHWRINEAVNPHSITEYADYITFSTDEYTYIYIKKRGFARVILSDLFCNAISYDHTLYLLSLYGFFYVYSPNGSTNASINIDKKIYIDPLTYFVKYMRRVGREYDPRLLDTDRKIFPKQPLAPCRVYSKKLCDLLILST